jgi:hypothetical protein
MAKRFDKVLYSFPLQLLIVQMKRNPSLIAVWILLVALFSGGIGKIYGVPYLFLDPEYINRVGFASFFIVGLCLGFFTMAYQITCYILDSHRFQFIGVLEQPFAKFSINNSTLPVLTLITYIILIIRFQLRNELSSQIQLVINLSGLVLGIVVVMTLFYIYFKFTNKDIFKFLSGSVDKRLMKAKISRDRVMSRYNEMKDNKYVVHSYFDLKLRLRSCSDLNDFYDKRALLKVFDQNHLNSVILELFIILAVIVLGTFMEHSFFQIPAAGSTLMMLSILVMLIGAISYWLKTWGFSFVFGIFLVVNLLIKTGVLKGIYEVRGLEYHSEKAKYTLKNLAEITNKEQLKLDFEIGLNVLNNWKKKQTSDKPKVVFLCVSGGGQRAALWTVNAMQQLDISLQGKLMDRTFMITGASGGMIGAAYYRELMRLPDANRPDHDEQLQNIGKDNLNSVIYSLLVNDAFFRMRMVEFEGKTHGKDRGYVFEENLGKNLKWVFQDKWSDYKKEEREAQIPTMLLAPVIANDGRKLYISNMPVSFLNVSLESKQATSVDNKVWAVDFNKLFKEQGADNLHFLSALRMSASFPYITPTISLPSEPRIEIMDAGIADNFGVSDAVHFISVFEDWITQNTSGVAIITIRDTRKSSPIEPQSNPSLVDRLTYPIASVYNNLGNMQDINNDLKVEALRRNFQVPLEVMEIEYNTYTNINEDYLISSKAIDRRRLERASLSWHLTTKEKQNIIQNIQLPNNQKAINEVKLFLSESN